MSVTVQQRIGSKAAPPRFGGVFWRVARSTNGLMIRFAGHRWNPIFSVVEHAGRRSGRRYAAPIAARRTADGFVISLAFGAQVDWYRNLVAAGGGTIRSRGRAYPVSAPARIDRRVAIAAFHPIQRFFLRLAAIDGYIHVTHAESGER